MNPQNIKNPIVRHAVTGAPLAALIGVTGFFLGQTQEEHAATTRAAIDAVKLQTPQMISKTVEEATPALSALATNKVAAKWNAYCLGRHSTPRYAYIGNNYVQATTDMPAVAQCLSTQAKHAAEFSATPAFTSTSGSLVGVGAGYVMSLFAYGAMLLAARHLKNAAKPE